MTDTQQTTQTLRDAQADFQCAYYAQSDFSNQTRAIIRDCRIRIIHAYLAIRALRGK